MRFTKMEGIGNDYIYINGLEETIADPAALSVRMSRPHFGCGSDGLILILPSDKADFRMQMFNNDGSESEMCGNGIRCVAKYCHDRGLTDKTDLTIETGAGVKRLHLNVKNGETVELDLKNGTLTCVETGEVLQGEVFGDFVLSILEAGGIKPLFRKKFSAEE